MAVVVTIGRNVGDVPMDPVRWADFRYEVKRTLQRHAQLDIYFEGDGRGFSEEWGAEDAYTLVCSDFIDEAQCLAVLGDLSHWAAFFKQEAVAVTIGDTLFVRP